MEDDLYEFKRKNPNERSALFKMEFDSMKKLLNSAKKI